MSIPSEITDLINRLNDEVIQVSSEDLGDLLGRVLEVKIKVERLVSRLE
ncbi:hypothetical protein PMG71_16865 [Roseofilum sp. BLCC_M154]|uniref:Uncharacterized protein n=1 Tax=Roseofilum acuticapitatum BLCC-M154 TaxID=3022444 RepID=A0ABT7AW14_9CYAN|nr:hypothetical protein [Roseofilum acuticapitatum]MDJ1171103.1 hypothetical protein [Roseofilum acuticapitatum BLCC-M154]